MNSNNFKPGGSRQTHFLFSALIWSCVGCVLLVKGWYRYPSSGLDWVLPMLAALCAGGVKSRVVLDRVASRIVSRIYTLADGTWLGAVYSLQTWLTVLAMIIVGVALKYSPLPTILRCFIYFTVGWALLFSSRHAWIAWRKQQREQHER